VNAVEAELVSRFASDDEVGEMDGVEGAPENGDPQCR
jgi:hypothetical protein